MKKLFFVPLILTGCATVPPAPQSVSPMRAVARSASTPVTCLYTQPTPASHLFDCSGSTPTPTPPVTPTPSPTPTPTPPPSGCGSPYTPFTLSNPNASAIHYGQVSTAYSTPLPRGPSGTYGYGFLQQGDNPGTPTEMTVEWSISKCPGDFSYYHSSEAAVQSPRGGTTFPCGGTNGAVGGTYYWTSGSPEYYQCRVDNTRTWYINVRYVNGCPIGVECPVSYYHSEN